MSLEELAKYTVISKYAKYLPEQKRRETWSETVTRCRDMHLRKYEFLDEQSKTKIKEVFNSVIRKECAPSMRSLQFGGEAIERKNARMYNCSVTHVYSSRSIEKAFWLLLCGCGVGLGFTKKYAQKFPDLISELGNETYQFTIPDTIEGWATSMKLLIDSYTVGNPYSGKIIQFDYSQIRPQGTPLSIGGKAPGPEGLKNAHNKVSNLIKKRIKLNFKKLKTIDLYDIMMHCSDAVLSGGIRRSATIALFDLDDEDMMVAKTTLPIENFCGNWVKDRFIGKVKYDGEWVNIDLSKNEFDVMNQTNTVSWLKLESQRGRSNNSALLNRNNLNKDDFLSIFNKTKQFGEPGFVFVDDEDSLYNPCAEIGFIPIINNEPAVQFCNLSIVNGNKVRTKEDLFKAVEYATIIGTLQAGYTNFPFLDKADEEITKQEALLGVSILGFMANPSILLDEEILQEASALAVRVNEEWSAKIGINKASRVTCVKPDGNSAAALESPFSGIHPAHSNRYFRRVQANKEENIYRHFSFYNSQICEPSIYSENSTDDVIIFPIEVKDGIYKKDLTAIEHLDIIKKVQKYWVNGGQKNNNKPISNSVSCTVMVKDNEWEEVSQYIYDNREYFSTISLLSYHGDKTYPQAPYEAIKTQEELEYFEKIKKRFMPVDYSLLLEEDDNTARSEELACVGGHCTI